MFLLVLIYLHINILKQFFGLVCKTKSRLIFFNVLPCDVFYGKRKGKIGAIIYMNSLLFQ